MGVLPGAGGRPRSSFWAEGRGYPMSCVNRDTCSADHDALAERLEQGDRTAVIVELEKRIAEGPCCWCSDLLALALFHDRQYERAAETLIGLIKDYDGDDERWWRRLTDARINIQIRLRQRGMVIDLPSPPDTPLPPAPYPDRFEAILARFGRSTLDAAGLIVTIALKFAVYIYGSVAGYKGRVWTRWYRRRLLTGLATLIHMRDKLNRENLLPAYPEGELTGFERPGSHPPAGAVFFRTADGRWNDLDDPWQGAANTRFGRNIRRINSKNRSAQEFTPPNPHTVSRELLARNGEFKPATFLNLLAVAWIQFMVHDWLDHGQEDEAEVRIQVDEGSELRDVYRVRELSARKSRSDGEYFYNEVTHWWDGSQIYGSKADIAASLRSGHDGKLRVDRYGLIPRRSEQDPVDDTGFHRNWWIGLSLLHNLFVWEHNAICDRLLQSYPGWDDNRLYNVARLINAAVMAKIHTVEWTPAIIPNRIMTSALNANWYGLFTYFRKRTRPNQRKTLSRANIQHAELGGVVGNPVNNHGVPFAFSEEFVEVYRMHCLFPDDLRIRTLDGDLDFHMDIQVTRDAGARWLLEHFATADLVHALATQNPGQLTLNNYPDFMRRMSTTDHPFFDLGAVDILRARERKVPMYNDFREGLGLNRVPDFEQLVTENGKTLTPAQEALVKKLGDLYQHPDHLDLLIGCLAEGQRPTGFGFGETVFQVFILNATRRLEADRFFTDFYNEATYTREGLQWIDDADMKSVLLRHMPELGKTNLRHVRNAFEPWDDDSELKNQERHPLRQFDKDFSSAARFISDDAIPVEDFDD